MRDDFVGTQREHATTDDDRGASLVEGRARGRREGERAIAALDQRHAEGAGGGEGSLDRGGTGAIDRPGTRISELGGVQAGGERDALAGVDEIAESEIEDVAGQDHRRGEGDRAGARERLRGAIEEANRASEGAVAADSLHGRIAEADGRCRRGVGRGQAQGTAEDFQTARVATLTGKGEDARPLLDQRTRAADGSGERAGREHEPARRDRRGAGVVGHACDRERAGALLDQRERTAERTDVRGGDGADGQCGRRSGGDRAETTESGKRQGVAVQVEGRARSHGQRSHGRQGRGGAETQGAGGDVDGAGMRGHRGEREHAGTRLAPDAGAGQAGGESHVIRADVERGDHARRDRRETGGKIGSVDAGPAQGGVGGEGHRTGTAGAGNEGERAAHEAEPAAEGARSGEGQRARAQLGHALGARDRRAEGAVARGRVEAKEGAGGEVAAGERGRYLGLRRRGAEGERRAGGDGPAAGGAEAAEGVARGDGQYAGVDGRDAGEARGGAGERESAGADLGQAACSGETAAGGTGGEFQRAGGDRQRAEHRGPVQADRTSAGLGERAGGSDGAGYGQGDADRDVEGAAGGADRQPTTGGQGEGSGGLQAAADEVQVVGVERARHATEGGVHRDRHQAACEDGATPIGVAGRRDAHGVDRGERERAGAFLTEGEVTVERGGERGRGGLADRERVQREGGIRHAAGGARERGDALVVAVEVEDAAGGREDQSGRDRQGVGAADLQDAVVDAGEALVGVGTGEQDHVLADLREAARTGDRAVDLEIRAAQARIVRVVRVGLVELALVVDTGDVPDAVAAARIRLAEEGIRGEPERDAGAELLDDGDVVPVTRDITHDRTTVERDRLAAGLAAHDLQVHAGRQRVIPGAGAVDGPTLEGAGLLDKGRRGRPAGHRKFQRTALLDRGGHAGGAERARMRDADGAFADEERTGAVEGRAVVAEGEDAVTELAEIK